MIIGFKLPQNIIMDILTHLEAKTITLAGEKMNLVDDCIIWVMNNSIFSITTDEGRKIIMQVKIGAKCKELRIIGKGKIPIDMPKLRKFLGRFAKKSFIEVIYKNGVLLLREPSSETELTLATKRIESIRYDFLNNLKKQIKNEKSEKDKKLWEFFRKYKSVYFMEGDTIANAFGIKLDNFAEVSSVPLKEVVKDGELLENRTYKFKVANNKLNIITKSLKEGDPSKASRNIYLKVFNFTSDFSIAYSSQFNAAVSSIKGHIQLYFGENKPLLLIKHNRLANGINMSFLVMPYLHKR